MQKSRWRLTLEVSCCHFLFRGWNGRLQHGSDSNCRVHILAFYNAFFTLHLFHLPSFSFKGFLPAFMMAWTRIFCWRQMFHIRNLNLKSFWSQSHTPITGVLSRFYVLLGTLTVPGAVLEMTLHKNEITFDRPSTFELPGLKLQKAQEGKWIHGPVRQPCYAAVQNGFCN